MFLNRFVLLIAMACLGPGPRGDRSVDVAAPCDSGPAAAYIAPSSSIIPAPSPHSGISRLAPWRHRIKSVLEDKVAWCLLRVDRGPAERPDLIDASIGTPLIAARSPALIPLRC
jgi:hypothetical protein